MPESEQTPFPATACIAEFVVATSLKEIPRTVISRGKSHFLDALGLGLAGAVALGRKIIRDYLHDLGVGFGGSTVFGSQMKTPARFAAFANGAAIHAHDDDDTTPQYLPDRNGGVHASGGTFPASCDKWHKLPKHK